MDADVDDAQDLYERVGGVTRLVSIASPTGTDVGGHVDFAGASVDGTHVFFHSTDGLAGGDTNGLMDTFERFDGTTKLVTAPATEEGGFVLDVNEEGTRALFHSYSEVTADDPDPPDCVHVIPSNSNVYCEDVYERSGGNTTLVSSSSAPADEAGPGGAERGQFAGERILFDASSKLIGADDDDPQNYTDVYARNEGGGIELLSPGDEIQEGAGNVRLSGAGSDDGTRGVPERRARPLRERRRGADLFTGPAQPDTGIVYPNSNATRVYYSGQDGAGFRGIYERSGVTHTLVSAPAPGGSRSIGDHPSFLEFGLDSSQAVFLSTSGLVADDDDGCRTSTSVSGERRGWSRRRCPGRRAVGARRITRGSAGTEVPSSSIPRKRSSPRTRIARSTSTCAPPGRRRSSPPPSPVPEDPRRTGPGAPGSLETAHELSSRPTRTSSPPTPTGSPTSIPGPFRSARHLPRVRLMPAGRRPRGGRVPSLATLAVEGGLARSDERRRRRRFAATRRGPRR